MIYASLEFKGRVYTYQSVKVTEINDISINGQPLLEKHAKSEVISNTFS